jgi:hypothetical protein
MACPAHASRKSKKRKSGGAAAEEEEPRPLPDFLPREMVPLVERLERDVDALEATHTGPQTHAMKVGVCEPSLGDTGLPPVA